MPIFAVSSTKVQLYPHNLGLLDRSWSYLHTMLLQYCHWILWNWNPYFLPFRNTCLPNEGHFANFTQYWLPWQRPLRDWKKRFRSIIYKQILIIWCKGCQNWSSGSWDNFMSSETLNFNSINQSWNNLSLSDHQKRRKKVINVYKIYSPVGNLAEQAK